MATATPCNGYAKDGRLILQADHLITRANSATYADTRLIVCVCKGHHGWKNWHKPEYDAVVRELIGGERAALWERCERDSWRPKRTSAYDWRLTIAALKQELRQWSRWSGVSNRQKKSPTLPPCRAFPS